MPATRARPVADTVVGAITGRRTAWAFALVPLLVAIAVQFAFNALESMKGRLF